MTVKELLQYAIIETKKNGAPNLLLEDYNYFINKAVQQTVNTFYNFYNADQQRTDDLRVLKDFVKIEVTEENKRLDETDNMGTIYEVRLPENYYHLISCQVQFKLKENWRCYEEGQKWTNRALRATGEINSDAINNAYFRPSYRNPYYYIINNAYSNGVWKNYLYLLDYKDSDFSTIEDQKMIGSTLDIIYKGLTSDNKKKVNTEYNTRIKKYLEEGGLISINDPSIKSKLQQAKTPDQSKQILGSLYNNVLLQLRVGSTDVFEVVNVFVDYLKTPQYIILTQKQFDKDIDTSQVLEFPEYVCQEILHTLVKLLLENYSDPRLQTNAAINNTIAPPAGVQQEQQGSRR